MSASSSFTIAFFVKVVSYEYNTVSYYILYCTTIRVQVCTVLYIH